MYPVELDGVNILLVDGSIGARDTTVIVEGVGSFDGEQFVVIASDGSEFELEEYNWSLVYIPITGVWKKKYPRSDFYIEIPKRE